MLVSVDVLLTEAPMSGDRTRFYRTCEKIRSSPYIEKILRAVRIMVRKYENGMVVFFILCFVNFACAPRELPAPGTKGGYFLFVWRVGT